MSYITEIKKLSDAGVGVILTRTREPFRAMDDIRSLAHENGMGYNGWDIRNGWRKYQDSTITKPETVNGTTDPYAAVRAVHDGNEGMTGAWCVMHALHPFLENHPPIRECLRQYVRMLADLTNLRLVLVVPEGFVLPDELSHDIPIVDYDLPSAADLHDVLNFCIDSAIDGKNGLSQSTFTEDEKHTLVSSAAGMTQMEAETAFCLGLIETKPTGWKDCFEEFNRVVLKAKTEVIKQSEVLEVMESISMDEVGGLENLKSWLTDAAKCFTPAAKEFGLTPPKGICAVGSPGTGKSLIAKATGTVFGMPLIKFDIGKCFGSLVGQSEARVRSAIKQLEAASPCCVLVDEVDKGLGGAHEGGGDSGVSKRVLGTILTAMEESKKPIFWIFSANRTAGLPIELLRKGRLDEIFAVMPPNRVERKAVFAIHLGKHKQDASKVDDLEKAVYASRGYVSAEIEAAVKEACKRAFIQGKKRVTGSMLVTELNIMKPMKTAFPEQFNQIKDWAKNNARAASVDDGEEDDMPPSEISNPVRRRRRGNI